MSWRCRRKVGGVQVVCVYVESVLHFFRTSIVSLSLREVLCLGRFRISIIMLERSSSSSHTSLVTPFGIPMLVKWYPVLTSPRKDSSSSGFVCFVVVRSCCRGGLSFAIKAPASYSFHFFFHHCWPSRLFVLAALTR